MLGPIYRDAALALHRKKRQHSSKRETHWTGPTGGSNPSRKNNYPQRNQDRTPMMIGNPLKFAIESEISKLSDRSSQMALGFFVIHVMERCYGVCEPNATTLGASLNEVGRRIARRGSHSLPAVMDAAAGSVAYAYRRTAYGEHEEDELFLGMRAKQFRDAVSSNHLVWAPDGDEAFDDGSYVLQVESQDQVRLIAFVGTPDFLYDPNSLRDLRLSGDEFYAILRDWHNGFEDELNSSRSKPLGVPHPS